MSRSEDAIPYLIFGAGIIGLQTAYALLKHGVAPQNIAIVETNIYPGEHSSSRNSGVLHAGLYYEAGSLKQGFCLEGNELWDQLAADLAIPLKRTGKYVVASTTDEVDALEALFVSATAKNVPCLSWRDASAIEPYVHCKKAFFSSRTGILDASHAIRNLYRYLQMKGVTILMRQFVEGIEHSPSGFQVHLGGEIVQAEHLINCAGLGAVELRNHLGLTDLSNYWVKGRYLKLNKPFFHESLIYPLPPPGLKGLGVHTSFDIAGAVRFGPDTQDVDAIDYSLDPSIVDEIYPAIEKVFKGVNRSDLSLDYSGIRSKIKHAGKLHVDFWIKSPVPNYWECLGIESPGLTASPAIAQYLVKELLRG